MKIATFLFLLLVTVVFNAGAEPLVFYSTSDFEITDYDLTMYLRDGPPPSGSSEVGSRARVLQALSDLYASRILADDAAKSGEELLSAEDADWIAEYEIRMETIRRYLRWRVAQMLEDTDWNQEAYEQYLGNKNDYVTEETVTIQTLLIRTNERSESEAMEIAESLIASDMTIEEFAAMVAESTEDDAAREQGGLMKDVKRGQTVLPFEKAAFALSEVGEISEPVITRFGVHVIQLLNLEPSVQLTFDQAKDAIISELKATRPLEYRAAIQQEARERKPEGFEEHTDALDALMLQTSDGPIGLR